MGPELALTLSKDSEDELSDVVDMGQKEPNFMNIIKLAKYMAHTTDS